MLIDEMARMRDEWRACAEYAFHLHQYGECAPGGHETWSQLERMMRSASSLEAAAQRSPDGAIRLEWEQVGLRGLRLTVPERVSLAVELVRQAFGVLRARRWSQGSVARARTKARR